MIPHRNIFTLQRNAITLMKRDGHSDNIDQIKKMLRWSSAEITLVIAGVSLVSAITVFVMLWLVSD